MYRCLPAIFCLSSMMMFASDAPDTRLQRANELLLLGSYDQAQAELQALLRQEQSSGQPALVPIILNNLAAIEVEMERYSQAERLYLRSMRAWEELPPADRKAAADPRLDMLSLYVQAGWLKKAELVAAQLSPASDPRQQVFVLDALGSLRAAQKRFDEAVAYYRQGLQLAEVDAGGVSAGPLWNSLAVALVGQGKLPEAVSALERALVQNERVWGPQHPVLIATLTNLGGVCLQNNSLERAASALARARELAEKTLGTSYPGLYRILLLQARAFELGKQKAEAKAVRKQAEMIRRSLHDTHTVDINDLARY